MPKPAARPSLLHRRWFWIAVAAIVLFGGAWIWHA